MTERQVVAYPQMVSNLFKTMETDAASLMHAAIGLSGESTELINAIYRVGVVGDGGIVEELGGARFYMQWFMIRFDWTTENLSEPSDGDNFVYEIKHHESFAEACGNLLDCIKKHWVYNEQLDTDQILYHMIYIWNSYNCLLEQYTLTDDEVKKANQHKLALRYPQGVYSDYAAQARADKHPETSYSGVKVAIKEHEALVMEAWDHGQFSTDMLSQIMGVSTIEALQKCLEDMHERLYVNIATNSNSIVLDLSNENWNEILKAASESKWMPREYMMNDWVSDICRWLRDGPLGSCLSLMGEAKTYFDNWWEQNKNELTFLDFAEMAQIAFDCGHKLQHSETNERLTLLVDAIREACVQRKIIDIELSITPVQAMMLCRDLGTKPNLSSITDQMILTIGRRHFKEDANETPETLGAFTDAVRDCLEVLTGHESPAVNMVDLKTGKPANPSIDEDTGHLLNASLKYLTMMWLGPKEGGIITPDTNHQIQSQIRDIEVGVPKLLHHLALRCENERSVYIPFSQLADDQYSNQISEAFYEVAVDILEGATEFNNFIMTGNLQQHPKTLLDSIGKIELATQKIFNFYGWTRDSARLSIRAQLMKLKQSEKEIVPATINVTIIPSC